MLMPDALERSVPITKSLPEPGLMVSLPPMLTLAAITTCPAALMVRLLLADVDRAVIKPTLPLCEPDDPVLMVTLEPDNWLVNVDTPNSESLPPAVTDPPGAEMM